jgi:hypothetical protein
MAPVLTQLALGLVTLPLIFGITSFFAVRCAATKDAAELAAQTYAANHCVDLL